MRAIFITLLIAALFGTLGLAFNTCGTVNDPWCLNGGTCDIQNGVPVCTYCRAGFDPENRCTEFMSPPANVPLGQTECSFFAGFLWKGPSATTPDGNTCLPLSLFGSRLPSAFQAEAWRSGLADTVKLWVRDYESNITLSPMGYCDVSVEVIVMYQAGDQQSFVGILSPANQPYYELMISSALNPSSEDTILQVKSAAIQRFRVHQAPTPSPAPTQTPRPTPAPTSPTTPAPTQNTPAPTQTTTPSPTQNTPAPTGGNPTPAPTISPTPAPTPSGTGSNEGGSSSSSSSTPVAAIVAPVAAVAVIGAAVAAWWFLKRAPAPSSPSPNSVEMHA